MSLGVEDCHVDVGEPQVLDFTECICYLVQPHHLIPGLFAFERHERDKGLLVLVDLGAIVEIHWRNTHHVFGQELVVFKHICLGSPLFEDLEDVPDLYLIETV